MDNSYCTWCDESVSVFNGRSPIVHVLTCIYPLRAYLRIGDLLCGDRSPPSCNLTAIDFNWLGVLVMLPWQSTMILRTNLLSSIVNIDFEGSVRGYKNWRVVGNESTRATLIVNSITVRPDSPRWWRFQSKLTVVVGWYLRHYKSKNASTESKGYWIRV